MQNNKLSIFLMILGISILLILAGCSMFKNKKTNNESENIDFFPLKYGIKCISKNMDNELILSTRSIETKEGTKEYTFICDGPISVEQRDFIGVTNKDVIPKIKIFCDNNKIFETISNNGKIKLTSNSIICKNNIRIILE